MRTVCHAVRARVDWQSSQTPRLPSQSVILRKPKKAVYGTRCPREGCTGKLSWTEKATFLQVHMHMHHIYGQHLQTRPAG